MASGTQYTLKGVSYLDLYGEEPSAIEQVYAIFANVLELGEDGQVLNAHTTRRRGRPIIFGPIAIPASRSSRRMRIGSLSCTSRHRGRISYEAGEPYVAAHCCHPFGMQCKKLPAHRQRTARHQRPSTGASTNPLLSKSYDSFRRRTNVAFGLRHGAAAPLIAARLPACHSGAIPISPSHSFPELSTSFSSSRLCRASFLHTCAPGPAPAGSLSHCPFPSAWLPASQ